MLKLSGGFLMVLALSVLGAGCAGGFKHFISADGDRLLDKNREIRFVSFNIPNLHYVEDDWQFDRASSLRLPDAFEIRDALESIEQLGGQVVRIYTLSVRRPDDPPEVPRHVLGPGRFNEEAFRTLDRVL